MRRQHSSRAGERGDRKSESGGERASLSEEKGYKKKEKDIWLYGRTAGGGGGGGCFCLGGFHYILRRILGGAVSIASLIFSRKCFRGRREGVQKRKFGGNVETSCSKWRSNYRGGGTAKEGEGVLCILHG